MSPWSWLWLFVTAWALAGICILLLGVATAYAVRQVREAWNDGDDRSFDERQWEQQMRRRRMSR